ncbi:hypothetical protein [Mycobacterium simiae]|uniref:hypothetical protein n=1 Tax=Mycobacterium simiae TaxID=1784 RepID=UPI000400BF79|nr:hypothetical protein [Mycobacterium simiae]PLV47999.1 hypothetical protein X011_17655 [Mycobacterium tuberculosis variant microti OV254]BBX43938.1 hypothetical protein MSIM_53890 [Mycobacterium simiae]
MTKTVARFQIEALIVERRLAMQDPEMPLWPPMELVFQRLPQLEADLAQALAAIELLQEHPELAQFVPPGGFE